MTTITPESQAGNQVFVVKSVVHSKNLN